MASRPVLKRLTSLASRSITSPNSITPRMSSEVVSKRRLHQIANHMAPSVSTSHSGKDESSIGRSFVQHFLGSALISVDLDSIPDPNNYYSTFVQGQKIATVPSFTFESGETLQSAPVAYSTWGALNANRDNVLVVCHALTGSSDAMDWWRPLIGPGKALDPTRYFIFCANVLGSPYGSASSLSSKSVTGRPYGAKFPQSTVRDDVRYVALRLDRTYDLTFVEYTSIFSMH